MTSNRKNVVVFAAVFTAFALPAWYYLQQHGWDEESLGLTLRISARIALLIYLVIFVARPLSDLAVSRLLVRNRRYLGISFAAIMTAHLYLLITLNGVPTAWTGMVVYAFIYLMLITSFNTPTAVLGPKRWQFLHKTGLYVIGIALAAAQFSRILLGQAAAIHYSLATLILIALGVRIAAWQKRRRRLDPALTDP